MLNRVQSSVPKKKKPKIPPVKSVRLDDAIVARLPLATTGQVFVRDTELPGFMVIVGTRAKTFAYQAEFTIAGKRNSFRRTIGRFGDPGVTTAKARRAAQLGLAEIKAQARVPEARRGGTTLAEAWESYLARLRRKGRQDGTVAFYQTIVDTHLATWSGTPLRKITSAMIKDRASKLTDESGPYRANGTLRALRAIWKHAAKSDSALPTCPIDGDLFNPEERRQTGMVARDLRAWKKKLDALPNPVRREFHLFTLLSGSRPDALSRAKWEHLDLRRRVLHFPDPKGGTKKAFDMPLSREMLACLVRVRKEGRVLHLKQSRTWIFPAASSPGHLVEWKENRDDLPKWGNDLRQTYKNISVEVEISGFISKLLMNHALADVNEGYASRSALALGDVARKSQAAISTHIVRHFG